jgi:allantoin racemase
MTTAPNSRYRFLMVPSGNKKGDGHLPKEQRLMDFAVVKPLLADVEWDMHAGAPGQPWVMSHEAFCIAASRLIPIVREACESGKYNALIILGGGDPGYTESREIGAKLGVPVVGCGWAQMHVACMLGRRFSVLDVPESHNQYYADMIVRYRLADRCASIRNVDDPNQPPGAVGKGWLQDEKQRALRGEPVPVVERAVSEAVAAIEEDGAEVITLGCSGVFWLKPFLEKRLKEIGWDVPVLDGYRSAITVAKLLVDLGTNASALTFPPDSPRKWRRKKFV